LIGIAALLGHNEPPRKLGLADASEFEGYLVGAMDEGAELVGFVVGVELVGFTVGAELVGFKVGAIDEGAELVGFTVGAELVGIMVGAIDEGAGLVGFTVGGITFTVGLALGLLALIEGLDVGGSEVL